jgi:hypothetical protein
MAALATQVTHAATQANTTRFMDTVLCEVLKSRACSIGRLRDAFGSDGWFVPGSGLLLKQKLPSASLFRRKEMKDGMD